MDISSDAAICKPSITKYDTHEYDKVGKIVCG